MALSREEKIRLLGGGETAPPATGGAITREQKIALLQGRESPAASTPGASGTWRETPSLKDALLPSFTEAGQRGGGMVRKGLGLGSDLASGVLRIPAAAGRTLDTKMGTAGDRPQSFRESLDQINQGEGPDGKKNLISGMAADPATLPSFFMGGPATAGIGKLAVGGLKAGLTSAGLHQGDRMARTGKADLGDAAMEVGINTAAPGLLKGAGLLVKKGVGGLKTILSKFSDVDEQALKAASDPEALMAASDITRRTGGDLSNMADNLGTKTTAMQADEASAIASVNARRQGTMESEMMRARPGAPNSAPSDVSAFNAGKRIEDRAKAGMASAGERFGQGQDDILINRGIGKKGVEFGGADGNQNAFEQTVDRYLTDAGVGQGGKQYGVIGNVSIPPGAINEIRSLKGIFQTAVTTRDMLDQLRLVDNRLSFGGMDGGRLFAFGSQEDAAMKGLRARLADDLENQIGRAAGKEKNVVVSLWNSHREAYHKTAEAFERIQEGLGVGKVNQETYFNRIKNIGVEDLRKISAEAKTNPDLRGTWNELRKGFFDNILASGIKDDGIDYNAIKKTWDTMDDDLKTVMMPTKVISHVDGVLGRTAPIDFKGQGLADNNRLVGKDRQSLIGSLENAGSKAKRSDLEDLKKLDDLLGLEGKDRFSEQAKSFYLGKQLGMTEKGKLSWGSGIRTGKVGLGLGAGLVAGGAVDGTEGGISGAGIGAVAGVAMQSPAGALAAYKLLNQMRKAAVMTERNVTRPLAARGLSSGLATRTLTTSQFGGEQNK